jgi:hypothetical protein
VAQTSGAEQGNTAHGTAWDVVLSRARHVSAELAARVKLKTCCGSTPREEREFKDAEVLHALQ